MKSKLGIVVLIVTLLFCLAAVIMNPALLVLGLVAGLVIGGWNLWNNIGLPPNQNNQKREEDIEDRYDSLEDDIRHHDYGYPGFGSDDEDDHHR